MMGVSVATSVSAILMSCVGDDPTTTNNTTDDSGAAGDRGAPNDGSAIDGHQGGEGGNNAPSLTLTPARPRVVRGSSVDVEVAIDRKGLTGDVAITLTGLPTGLTASETSIPAASNVAVVVLTAAVNAPMGTAHFFAPKGTTCSPR